MVAAGLVQALAPCLVMALHPPGHMPSSLRRPDHGAIGLYDLLAVGAGVFEFLGFAGAVEVAPDSPQVWGDPEAAVMLADDLWAGTG